MERGMKHYALIGRRLSHSFSKSLFDSQRFADADYRLCPMPSLEGLRQWVREGHIDGFNVTNPYKQTILPWLDRLSPEARSIGAVNCVVVEEGRLTGYNTDASAFRQSLEALHCPQSAALILGTGGAAHAVAYALEQLAIPCRFVSRHPERHPNAIGYDSLSDSEDARYSLIVNATPVGTYPDVDASPLPADFQFSRFDVQLVYDLVYNPSPSLLLRQAAAQGIKTKDGSEMLRLQAVLSWQLWQLL